MRPGSLTQQYHISKDKKYLFWQISYTCDMKSHSGYVKKKFVENVKKQIKNYKLFKRLTKKWADLSLEYSKIDVKSKMF